MNEKCVKSSLVFWLNERKVSVYIHHRTSKAHISHLCLYVFFFFGLWHISTTDWNSWRVFVISVARVTTKQKNDFTKTTLPKSNFFFVSSSSGWLAIGRSMFILYLCVINNIRLLRAILIPFYRYRSCICENILCLLNESECGITRIYLA